MKNEIKTYQAKADKKAEKIQLQIEVLNIPETLEELLQKESAERVLEYVVAQVLAHSCYTSARNYYLEHKGTKKLEQWGFCLPSKKKEGKAKKLENENATLKAENMQKDVFIAELQRQLAESQKQLAKRMKK